jgi:hypothetical protein
MRKILLLALFVTAPVLSQVRTGSGDTYVNGNKLLHDCSSSATDQLYCAGYIAGASDTDMKWRILMAQIANGDRNFSSALSQTCITKDVTLGQVQDVVVKYLVAHPETRHYSAGYLVGLAVQEAFPCPKEPGS